MEAAALDGCGDARFMLQILLPMEMPILTTLTLQSLIAAWNNYLWPLMVTDKPAMRTVQVGISMLTSTDGMDYPLVLAGVTISLIPAIVAFWVLRNRTGHAIVTDIN